MATSSKPPALVATSAMVVEIEEEGEEEEVVVVGGERSLHSDRKNGHTDGGEELGVFAFHLCLTFG